MDDRDREIFMDKLSKAVDRYGFIFHSYCLMDNHYHLLIETPNANLSLGMQRINGDYTQAFNRRHERSGHLFQGRFKAILVEKEKHLLELCRYIVLNPVRAGMAENTRAWVWSSYRALAGFAARPDFLTIDWVLSQFGGDSKQAIRRYRTFVRNGLKKKESPLSNVSGQIVLGGDDFIEGLKKRLEPKKTVKEYTRSQRLVAKKPLSELFPAPGSKEGNRAALAERVWQAHAKHGYTLTAIANYLGVHCSTASRLAGLAREQQNDKA